MTRNDPATASLQQALADAEAARDQALAHAASLQRQWQAERQEEQHRLRNLCSVIRAIAQRTGDDVETVEEYSGILDGRLSAYLRVQANVMRNWHDGANLALLLAGTLQAFGLKEGERLDLAGPPVTLRSEAAGILALVFHELAVGVILSDRIGEPASRLKVRWRLVREDGKRSFLIEWIETASADKCEEAPTSWADWLEQAIQYQLAGSIAMESGAFERITRVCLPGSVLS